jgi:hypothetical protein
VEIAAEILAHYAEGQEHARLTSRPSLELLRTRVLLERFLPTRRARAGHRQRQRRVCIGLRLQDLLPIEGPLHWAPGIQDRLSDSAQRQLILDKWAAGCRPS